MSKCANQSHPDFIDLMNKTGVNRTILAAQVSLWMDKNNTDVIPSMKDIDLNYTLKTAPELYKEYNITNNNGLLKELSFEAANKWLATNNKSPNYSFKLSKLPSGRYTLLIQDKESNLGKEVSDTTISPTTPTQGTFFQKPEIKSSTASPKTISLLKQFIKQIGVDINNVKDIVVDGKRMNADGAALLMQKLIQVVEGKEAVALPEEAMHFAVAIIKQTNPKLYQQLLKEINNYNIYNQVLADYSGTYLTKDGKPDIQKLKEEAIGKLLAETIIKQSEGFVEKPENLAKVQSWWKNILDWIKGLFIKSGVDQLAMDILSGKNIGTAEDINEEGTFFQLSKQAQIVNALKDTASKIEKREDGYYINGKKVPKRVTELVKDWYSQKFKNQALTKSEFQTAVDGLKAENGTKGHADFEYAFSVFIDENGDVRETPLDDSEYTSQLNPNNRNMYEMLRDNLKERIDAINNKAPGTKFFSELMVYNPKVYGGLGGTIDFLSVSPEGKVNIYDWKFMNLNTEKYEDVPWYKINAWQEQMKQYKLMLQNVYGVKSEDFEQTRMVPIQAIYTEGNAKNNVLPVLKSIKIGDVNVQNIKEDFLLPVGLESESTGNKKIDKLLEKLNGEYKRLSEKKITEAEKASKAEALNQLFTAIRQLQIKQNLAPIVKQAQLLNKQIEQTIKKFDNYKNVDPKTVSEEAINEFSNEIIVAQDMVKIYTNIDLDLAELFLENPDEKLEEALAKTANTARKYEKLLEEKLEEFSENIIAKSENINNFLTPEKVVKGITKMLGLTSTIQLKSLQLLFKKANKSLAYAAQDALDETKKLLSLKESYDKWALSKGLSIKNYFSFIKKQGSNELIDEYNPEFYKKLKEKIEDKDYQWIRDNVDQSAYREKIKELLQEELERIENKTRVGTDEEINQELSREKKNAQALFNVSTPTSPGWLLYDKVNKFPLDKWFTKEWIELNKPENKPAKDFYDYIREKNAEYKELGYIGRGQDRTFLPFVRKGLVEKLIFGGKISLGEQFLRSISVDEGDVGYGKIDPLTGKPIDSIPKYFTSEIEGEVSEDLFKTMSLYNEMALKYKYVSQIESTMEAISRVEKNKKAIRTSIFGRTEYKNGQLQTSPDNSDNAKLLEDSIKAIIYGQRFIQSEVFDQLLGKLGNWGETFNKKLGVKIFPENLSDRQISVNKVIDAFNGQFQLNTLGLNALSSISNLFGGTAQSIINSGKWFTKAEYIASQFELFTNRLTNDKNREKYIGALEYFLPLTENYNREISKKLSLSKLSQENFQDFLMIMMRKTDFNVQMVNFMSFLKNSVVVDNKIINAREYLRASEKYNNKYSLSKENRDKLDKEFEEDVKNLIKEKGVLAISKIEDGKLVIPGIERKSESVLDLRRKVQSLTADALGQASPEDIRNINLTVIGKSFMIFKGWIPRLVDVRFGNIKYNSKSDAYEWGRMRTIFKYLSDDTLGSINNLISSLKGTDKGVAYIRELYEKKKADYEKDTGKELELTSDQFIDLVRNNIRNQMYDTIFLLTLLSLGLALKAAAPDKDEDAAVRNQYKFLMKAADKLRDEISYFYDPTSFSSMFSSGLFPSLALLENFKKTFKNFLKENYYILTDNEKEEEKNFVIKYAMRSFPFTNQVLGYLPMWYPTLAKDLGIKMQSNYGIR